MNARARAMGGTNITTARGVDALFNNASYLSRVEGYSFKILGANVAASSNSQRLLDQQQNGGDPLTAESLQGLYGETYFVESSLQAGMVFPYFGFGVYSSNYTTEIFNNPVFPTFNVDFLSEYGYIIAGAVPIGPQAALGITGRHMKRWSGNEDILVTDLIGTTDKDLIESRFQDKGTGNALDVSFLFSLPQENIDFAVVWKDIGNTAFTADAGDGPERQHDNLSFGVSKIAKHSLFDVTYAFQYDHIRLTGVDISKKLHIGAEVNLGFVDVRAGLSQGYLSYGAGVDLWLITIDAAAYSEEMGSYIGERRSDRYQASISLNLDFDQAFKLRTESGKKRRLLQRR